MMYTVIAGDGSRYGPVGDETILAWQGEGRLLPDMELEEQGTQRRLEVRETPFAVQELGPLSALTWTPTPAAQKNGPDVNSASTLFDTPSQEGRIGPFAPEGTTEYRARTRLSPLEAASGSERRVEMDGLVKTVPIPGQTVGPDAPRIKYRIRSQGLPLPDGTPTDLLLLVEYASDGIADPPIPIVAKPASKDSSVQKTLMPQDMRRPEPEAQPSPKLTPPPPDPAIVYLNLTRRQAQEGGIFEVILPVSGLKRYVPLDPGFALTHNRMNYIGRGEPLPTGGIGALKVFFTVQG